MSEKKRDIESFLLTVSVIIITIITLMPTGTEARTYRRANVIYQINSTHCELCYVSMCKIRNGTICNIMDNKSEESKCANGPRAGVVIGAVVAGFVVLIMLCRCICGGCDDEAPKERQPKKKTGGDIGFASLGGSSDGDDGGDGGDGGCCGDGGD